MTLRDPVNTGRPSRGEVERLCLLQAIGSRGCPPEAIAERLGLSSTLSGAVAGCVPGLVAEGLVEVEGVAARLTAEGAAFLRTRLAQLGVD